MSPSTPWSMSSCAATKCMKLGDSLASCAAVVLSQTTLLAVHSSRESSQVQGSCPKVSPNITNRDREGHTQTCKSHLICSNRWWIVLDSSERDQTKFFSTAWSTCALDLETYMELYHSLTRWIEASLVDISGSSNSHAIVESRELDPHKESSQVQWLTGS